MRVFITMSAKIEVWKELYYNSVNTSLKGIEMFEKTSHLPKVKNKGRVLIVGAGIIGITTAYQFLKAGYKNVTVYSKEDPLQTN